MKKTSVRLLMVGLILSLATIANAAKKNKKSDSTDDGGVHAKIMGVGGNGKLIVQVTPTDGSTTTPQTVILQTNASTTVEIDGQPAKLTDLQAGETAVLQGDASGSVTDIKASKVKNGSRKRK